MFKMGRPIDILCTLHKILAIFVYPCDIYQNTNFQNPPAALPFPKKQHNSRHFLLHLHVIVAQG